MASLTTQVRARPGENWPTNVPCYTVARNLPAAQRMAIPKSVIDRSGISASSRVTAYSETVCARHGDRIFILPTTTVEYTKAFRDGSRRSQLVSLVNSSAPARDASGFLIVDTPTGGTHRFPRSARVLPPGLADYEIIVIGANKAVPRVVAGRAPNFVAP